MKTYTIEINEAERAFIENALAAHTVRPVYDPHFEGLDMLVDMSTARALARR